MTRRIVIYIIEHEWAYRTATVLCYLIAAAAAVYVVVTILSE